jgi:hypothetical protein
MGKSTLLENMAIQDIRNGEGLHLSIRTVKPPNFFSIMSLKSE